MAVNKVDYGTNFAEDLTRNPSQAIWGRCPTDRMQEDYTTGYYFFDDFTRTGLLTTPTITSQAYYNNGWKAFAQTTGTLVAGQNTALGEGLKGVTQATANNLVSLATLANPFLIAPGQGAFFFECRLNVSTVAANNAGLLVGLMDLQTLTATSPLQTSQALATAINFVGFQTPVATPGQLNTLYQAGGVTPVAVESNVLGDCPTTTAILASTFIKLGMTYEPYAGPYGSTLFSWYVNGFRLATRKVVPVSAGTDFPNSAQLGPVIAVMNGSTGAAVTLNVDWIAAAQVNGLSLLA